MKRVPGRQYPSDCAFVADGLDGIVLRHPPQPRWQSQARVICISTCNIVTVRGLCQAVTTAATALAAPLLRAAALVGNLYYHSHFLLFLRPAILPVFVVPRLGLSVVLLAY
ncbi:hypothetical protein Micbo1qcDRAFT_159139, partial [Microdochium bolleyi]